MTLNVLSETRCHETMLSQLHAITLPVEWSMMLKYIFPLNLIAESSAKCVHGLPPMLEHVVITLR